MSRCQHCNKLTHDEHLYVYVDVKDMDKIEELTTLSLWTAAYMYRSKDPREFGKLNTPADIVIHFIVVDHDLITNLK